MTLLARLLLGAVCALAAPAAQARSWVMTPDPVVLAVEYVLEHRMDRLSHSRDAVGEHAESVDADVVDEAFTYWDGLGLETNLG